MLFSASESWSRPFFDPSIFHKYASLSYYHTELTCDRCWHIVQITNFTSKDHKFIEMKAMMFLEKQEVKEKLKSTGFSLFYRATGRDTRPIWGNRIVKDFYDLDYDVKHDMVKFNQHFKCSDSKATARTRADIKRSKVAKYKTILDNHNELLSDRRKSLTLRDKQPKHSWQNPETIEVGALLNSSSKTQGLSPFEFSNTIQGRMQKRRNLHISYDNNKSSRIINQYPIFYDRNHDLDFSHSKMMEERKLMKTYHPFTSYSERKVFQPRNELDKVFETERAKNATLPKRTPAAVLHFQKTMNRIEPKLSESMVLTYETTPSILYLKKKSTSFSIQKSQRSTSFSREVISQKRGCKR